MPGDSDSKREDPFKNGDENISAKSTYPPPVHEFDDGPADLWTEHK